MAQGRTVKIDGIGTFYYTASSTKKGVQKIEDVSASQITSVRVRYIPEVRRNSSRQVITRSMVDSNIFWEEWGDGTHDETNDSNNGNAGSSAGTEDGSSDGGVIDDNPLE